MVGASFAICALLSRFTEKHKVAFAESTFNDKALVRGVYFTSGTQQGAPIDRLLGSLSRTLDIPATAAAAAKSGGVFAGAAKSFFLTRLMQEVIFPEAGLAGYSEQREKRLRLVNWAMENLPEWLLRPVGVSFLTTILVPSPNVAEDHQTKNAQALVDKGAAVMIADKDAGTRLVDEALKLLFDEQRAAQLRKNIATLARPNATADIVKEIEKLIKP